MSRHGVTGQNHAGESRRLSCKRGEQWKLTPRMLTSPCPVKVKLGGAAIGVEGCWELCATGPRARHSVSRTCSPSLQSHSTSSIW